jgi:protein SCO1/2
MPNFLREIIHITAVVVALSVSLPILSATTRAQLASTQPAELKKIDVQERLGQTIPLDLMFTNDAGEYVSLDKYFHRGKPVILVLAYYECPMLCTLVLNGLANAIGQLDWFPGKQYQVLTVSINPAETPELALGKKKNLIAATGKSGIDDGWRFFVGKQDQIAALTDAVGFRYFYDDKQKQFAHPALIMLLTEDGKLSRYLYGVEFKKQDLRLALLEASNGRIGNTVDKIILYCYHYNPDARGYVLFATNVMKLGGGLTLMLLALFLAVLWAKERGKKAVGAAAP